MTKLVKRLKNIGPGALVAAAFIGPGTVTSCSKSGASYGYTLLWAMLLSVISVIIMQLMAARVGIVSKMGLGQALREKFTGKTARILLALLVIAAVFIGNIAYETGNITGSVLGIQSALPAYDEKTNEIIRIILVVVIAVVAVALLWTGSHKYIEKFLTALVVIMGVIFLITAIASKPDWMGVLKGLFGFQVPQEDNAWMTIAALMGTTVVPYNIYLHASSAAKKWSEDEDVEDGLANSRLDSILSIGLGGIISMAIIVCASATKDAVLLNDPSVEKFVIETGGDMAKSLEPLLGNWATIIFGIGLFAAGISSAITAPLAAAFASTGILGWDEDLKDWKFRIFWVIVVAFGLFASIFLGSSPTEIILFAQAANAFLLPVTGILLLLVANDKKIMKEYNNKLVFNILAILVIVLFIVIATRNMTAFVTSFKNLVNSWKGVA